MGVKFPIRFPYVIPRAQHCKKKSETIVAASAIGSSDNSNMSVISSFGKELKTPDRFQRSAIKRSVVLSKTTKSRSFPDDLGAMALPYSGSTNGTFIRMQIPAPPIAPKEAVGSANIESGNY
jgi:hypothetical protein